MFKPHKLRTKLLLLVLIYSALPLPILVLLSFRLVSDLRLLLLLLLVYLATSLFSFWSGRWFIHRFIQPLETLETGIKLVRAGLMGDELPVQSQDEIGRLTQTFNQMTRALALHNEDIRTKTRDLSFFNTITQIINQSADLNILLDQCLHKMAQMLHAPMGLIYVYHHSARQFSLMAHLGVEADWAKARATLPAENPLLSQAFENGEPALVRDVAHHPALWTFLRLEIIRDLVYVPLRTKKRPLGVLIIGSHRKHHLHYRDLELLKRLGDEIGVAIENAMLYAELELKIKQLEKANQELQDLDRFKSHFLSNVSHELRTPLTTIKTYIELFLGDRIGRLETEQKDKLVIVRRNVNNLLNLINDLLMLSRLEDKASPVWRLEPLLVNEILEQVWSDTCEMAKNKGLDFQREIAAEKFMVLASRQGLRQVIQNLVVNAIKFTEHGRITLTLQRSAPGPEQPGAGGEWVEISVQDTGIGIPENETHKLFQRFYQVDASSTRKYVGTGLGLAIVKEIIEAHHSAIQVRSRLGEGSCFSFRLPVWRLHSALPGDPVPPADQRA